MEIISYAGDIVNASEYEGAEEFDPFENTEENIEIVPDSPPETKFVQEFFFQN